LLNGCSSKKLMLTGGGGVRVYNLLSLVPYPPHVHFASLTLSQLSTRARIAHAPEQGHNHILDSIALNYPCLINQLRVVSHNRTKYRENGTHEQNYFLPIMSMSVYNTPLGSRMGTASRPSSTFLRVDGGCSRIFSSGTSQGARW
jgi:hypothetical protein